jgi:hypothetical protein
VETILVYESELEHLPVHKPEDGPYEVRQRDTETWQECTSSCPLRRKEEIGSSKSIREISFTSIYLRVMTTVQ